MTVEETGCCGAYCGTCRVIAEGLCKGCKAGYDNGERDITRAKCAMKVCCVTKKYGTCADCPNFTDCATLAGFYGKNGYKYKKYREALEFIRLNGYQEFLVLADQWKGPYGKL